MKTDRFNTIAIFGVGLIGGSLGLALKRKDFSGKIIGVSQKVTLDNALTMGAIDQGFEYHDMAKACQDADLIYLCTPIQRIKELITQIGIIGPKLKKDCVITDVGSTKLDICRHAAEKLPAHLPFIGGHPMTGSEKTGVTSAEPFLFENAIYVLTPGNNVPADVGHALSSFHQKLGAKVILLDPAVHDKIAAVISHVPQLLAVALMRWALKLNKDNNATLQLAAGGFRDMTRIASSSYDMWKDILDTNNPEIEKQLNGFIAELNDIRIDLVTGKLQEKFGQASAARHSIPKDSKGFIGPLHEILVVADDRPGVIAQISNELAKENININDIEVIKVREGEGGTLRMGFDSRASAEKAISLLSGIHFQARMRE